MKFYLLVLSLFFTFAVSSQNLRNKILQNKKSLTQFNVDNWTNENGLPTNSLIDICQTADGYIWISSYNGLIRFDGYKFKVFDKSNTEALKDNGIGALAEDKNGVLWMTTQNEGLVSYKNGEFEFLGRYEPIPAHTDEKKNELTA